MAKGLPDPALLAVTRGGIDDRNLRGAGPVRSELSVDIQEGNAYTELVSKARVAELGDALDLGSSPLVRIGVQIPSLAPVLLIQRSRVRSEGVCGVAETDVAVKIEDISPVVKKLSFDIPWSDVKKGLDDVYRTVAKTAKIRGFRPGRIPREVLEAYYREHAENEVITNIVNKFTWDVLKENSIDAVTQPSIDQQGIEKDKNFLFTATVEVEPAIDPAGYAGLELEKVERVVTEETVAEKIEELRQMFSTLEEVKEERGAAAGDYVEIDFQGRVDGEALEKMKGENTFVEIGAKRFVPGFEDNLIGMMRKEEKEFTVTLPDDYFDADLTGKEAVFTVTLKDIKEKKLPELDESFVRYFDRYETLEELRQGIRTSLEEEYKVREEGDLRNLIIDKLLSQNDFTAPPSFVERQKLYLTMDTQRRMVAGGMNRKDAAELSTKMHDSFDDEATRIVKSFLILKSIARKEALEVSDDEMDEKIRDIASKSDRSYDAVRKSFENEDVRDSLKEEMLHKKVIDFIVEKAHLTTVQADADVPEEGKL
jgi:trigger factor